MVLISTKGRKKNPMKIKDFILKKLCGHTQEEIGRFEFFMAHPIPVKTVEYGIEALRVKYKINECDVGLYPTEFVHEELARKIMGRLLKEEIIKFETESDVDGKGVIVRATLKVAKEQ